MPTFVVPVLVPVLGLEGTKMDHASLSSTATSSGSEVCGGARGTVTLSDLRTVSWLWYQVLGDADAGKSGQVGGSVPTRVEPQVVACSSCYADPRRTHRTEEAGKVTLRAGARRSRRACMEKRARLTVRVRVRTTTSHPRQGVLPLERALRG